MLSFAPLKVEGAGVLCWRLFGLLLSLLLLGCRRVRVLPGLVAPGLAALAPSLVPGGVSAVADAGVAGAPPVASVGAVWVMVPNPLLCVGCELLE